MRSNPLAALERLDLDVLAQPYLEATSAAAANDLPASSDIVDRVMDTLFVAGPAPTVRMIAAILGTSVRTLQRRLAAAGCSYEQLIETTRQVSARRLLDSTDAKVIDITFDLGYSDHAHFTRAFGRWTGLSPVAYRRARFGSSANATG